MGAEAKISTRPLRGTPKPRERVVPRPEWNAGSLPTKVQMSKYQLTSDALKHAVFFTTGQVAVLCRVAPRTAAAWFNDGRFPNAYRLPKGDGPSDNGDRRIPRADVVAFMKKYKIPIPPLLLGRPNYILVGMSVTATKSLTDLLRKVDPETKVSACGTPGEGLRAAFGEPLDGVAVDFSVGAFAAKETARMFRDLTPRRVGVAGFDFDPDDPGLRPAFTGVVRECPDLTEVAELLVAPIPV